MVMFADEEIPTSPIKVSVASNHNAKKVRVEGPGVEKDGEKTFFCVNLYERRMLIERILSVLCSCGRIYVSKIVCTLGGFAM